MTVPVPTQLSVVSGWAVADWLDKSSSAAADGTGTAEIDLTVPDSDRWQLTHMLCGVVSPLAASTAAPAMRLYLNSVSNAGLRDGTEDGGFDVADWPLGLWVAPGDQLIARFTGCDPGSTAILSLQATIYRRAS